MTKETNKLHNYLYIDNKFHNHDTGYDYGCFGYISIFHLSVSHTQCKELHPTPGSKIDVCPNCLALLIQIRLTHD